MSLLELFGIFRSIFEVAELEGQQSTISIIQDIEVLEFAALSDSNS